MAIAIGRAPRIATYNKTPLRVRLSEGVDALGLFIRSDSSTKFGTFVCRLVKLYRLVCPWLPLSTTTPSIAAFILALEISKCTENNKFQAQFGSRDWYKRVSEQDSQTTDG
ncbi:hypothetical protein [Scytonema sp. PCC 10023]|uniref:hypothetical protein n=1 Tax=Scytonema sp. PCC 10023 TaxID=1680591 RepID=UPI0039C71A08